MMVAADPLVIGPVVMGQPEHRLHLDPIMADPPTEIRSDAGIDMRRAEQWDPLKRWWLAVKDGQLVAFCAVWHTRVAGGGYECGHNYELGWRGRDERWWPLVHRARHLWLVQHRVRATTWLHDEDPASATTSMVVALHLADGWVQTDEAWSLDNPGQYCRQLAWRPEG